MDTVTMAGNGRLVVPAEIRQRLGVPKGGKLVIGITDGVLTLEPFEAAVRRAQAKARSYLKPGESSVVEAFLAERRTEAQRDDHG